MSKSKTDLPGSIHATKSQSLSNSGSSIFAPFLFPPGTIVEHVCHIAKVMPNCYFCVKILFFGPKSAFGRHPQVDSATRGFILKQKSFHFATFFTIKPIFIQEYIFFLYFLQTFSQTGK
jgi:hypothetical protein